MLTSFGGLGHAQTGHAGIWGCPRLRHRGSSLNRPRCPRCRGPDGDPARRGAAVAPALLGTGLAAAEPAGAGTSGD